MVKRGDNAMGTILSADKYKDLLHSILFLQNMSSSFSQAMYSELCNEINHVQAELADICDTFLTLAKNSCSAICAEFANTYLDYSNRIGEDWQRLLSGPCGLQSKAETLTLYSEFAVDFANLTVKYALLSTLYAQKIQTEEK